MGVVIFVSMFRPSNAGIIRILPKNIKAVAEVESRNVNTAAKAYRWGKTVESLG